MSAYADEYKRMKRVKYIKSKKIIMKEELNSIKISLQQKGVKSYVAAHPAGGYCLVVGERFIYHESKIDNLFEDYEL